MKAPSFPKLAFLFIAAIGVAGRTAPAAGERADAPPAQRKLIRNHATWLDIAGNRIDCHEGGILRVGDRYYWYGRQYKGNDKGTYGTGGARFRCGINCYSSPDLIDWTFEGTVLSYPDAGRLTEGTWHRPRVVYNQKTAKYVLWFFCLGTPGGKPWVQDVVATADKPAGPFQIIEGERKMPGFAPSGDLALLVDGDGTGYLANGDWNRNGYVVRLADDFLSAPGPAVKALPAGQGKSYEGLSLVRHRGKVILAGSGVAGLDPSDTTYAVADNPMGPYVVKGLMSEQKTWRSQISSFCVIPETDTLFALCEQWLTGPDGKPTTAERSTQLWLPVTFDPTTGKAKMRYVREWDPREKQE